MKHFKIVKTFLLFSFLIGAFASCDISWFGDIKQELENDTNSQISFYAQKLEDNPDTQVITVSCQISSVFSENQFPTNKMDIIKPGYHIDYWHYYRDHNSESEEAPDNVSFDGKNPERVVSIKITPQYFDLYGVWAPNTDTKYKVEHYFQNLTLDDYDMDDSRTQIMTGTTDEQSAAESYVVEGFEAVAFSQQNINGDESTVIKIYYNRCKEVVVLDYSNGTTPVEHNGYYGQTISELNIPDRTEEGYSFDKWQVFYEDGTTAESTATYIIYPAQKVTYKAVWKELTYTITWETRPNGGKVQTEWTKNYTPVTEFTVSTGCILPSAADISRRGYIFGGWYTDAGCIVPAQSWSSGQKENKVFYAKWTPIVYTVTYVVNEGTLDGTQQLTYTIEDTVRMPGIERTGWYFKGWYTASDFSGSAVTTWYEGDRNEDLTVYAKWTEIPYTITWETKPNGGKVDAVWTAGYSPKETYTIITGCTLPDASNISRRGYTFGGWYTDKACTVNAESWISGEYGDKSFYAKWTPIVYTITYVVNEGTLDGTQQLTYTIEDTVRMPGITRTGWRFNGWFTSADFTGTAVTEWTEGDRNENISVYAKWTEINSQISGINITYPVESDKNLSLTISYNQGTNTWTYSVDAGYADYKWFFDSSQLVWSGNSDINVSLGLSIEPGYHNILVVATDAAGNEYSAAAVIQVIK